MRGNLKRLKIAGVVLSVLLIVLCAMSGCVQDYGEMYLLEDAYAAQWIDRDDLLNIAYYNGDIIRNEEALQGFTPEPIGELDEKTAQRIRECVAERYRNNGAETGYEPTLNTTAEYIHIIKYLGCYNGYYAVRYCNTLFNFTTEEKDPNDYIQEADGIRFVYLGTSKIFLWKQN